jgi:hypothetical protein
MSHRLLFVEFLGSFTKSFASFASKLMAFENKIHINCIGGLTTFLGSFLTIGTGFAFLSRKKLL